MPADIPVKHLFKVSSPISFLSLLFEVIHTLRAVWVKHLHFSDWEKTWTDWRATDLKSRKFHLSGSQRSPSWRWNNMNSSIHSSSCQVHRPLHPLFGNHHLPQTLFVQPSWQWNFQYQQCSLSTSAPATPCLNSGNSLFALEAGEFIPPDLAQQHPIFRAE